MSEGYARVSGHVSASSPEKLPLKRNAGTVLILPLGIEVSELASEFLKAVSILVMPVSQRSS